MTLRTPLWLAAGMLMLAPAADAQNTAAPAKPKKLFCWQQNGQRVCSDALPPEAVNIAREEISASSGLRTGGIDRALTDEERAQAAVAEQQRLMDEAAAETRRRTDAAMLLSYRNEDDLRRVFSERALIVDNNIRTADYNALSLREGLVSLLQSAGDKELAGRPITADAATAIRQRHAELVRTRRLQQSFEAQRKELNGEIADILRRYRTMKGDAAALDAAAATETPLPPPPATTPARN